MDFVKMEALGNDFVVVTGPRRPSPEDVARWCDRRRGVGADGVLVVTAISADRVGMDYWNADGSVAEMCGNGLRCVGRHAVTEGMVEGPELVVETPVGERTVIVGDQLVRAQVGRVDAPGTVVELAGYRLESVLVGNPHAVAFVDDCGAVPVSAAGPLVEGDPAYPERTNVEFASVVSPTRIRLRVWERGVGETLACGSGAAAAVAAAHGQGLTGPRVEVEMPGGTLLVELMDGEAWLEGPATEVYRGTIGA